MSSSWILLTSLLAAEVERLPIADPGWVAMRSTKTIGSITFYDGCKGYEREEFEATEWYTRQEGGNAVEKMFLAPFIRVSCHLAGGTLVLTATPDGGIRKYDFSGTKKSMAKLPSQVFKPNVALRLTAAIGEALRSKGTVGIDVGDCYVTAWFDDDGDGSLWLTRSGGRNSGQLSCEAGFDARYDLVKLNDVQQEGNEGRRPETIGSLVRELSSSRETRTLVSLTLRHVAKSCSQATRLNGLIGQFKKCVVSDQETAGDDGTLSIVTQREVCPHGRVDYLRREIRKLNSLIRLGQADFNTYASIASESGEEYFAAYQRLVSLANAKYCRE